MAYYPPVVVPEPRSSTAHIVVAWVLAVVTAFYLLPWAIAATRSHPNTVTIALLNVFLGWTGVGWLATLIWACISPSRPAVVVPGVAVTPVAPYYPLAALPPGAVTTSVVSSTSIVSAHPVSAPSAAYPYGPVSGSPYDPPPHTSYPYGPASPWNDHPSSAITAYPLSGPSASYPAYQPPPPAAEPTGWTATAPTPFPTSASTADLTPTQSLPVEPAPTRPLPVDQAWPLAEWQARTPGSSSGFHD